MVEGGMDEGRRLLVDDFENWGDVMATLLR